MTSSLTALVGPDGRLRVAINTGNAALVQVRDGAMTGVSPALARRLAETLGVEFHPVIYPGAGKVVADADAGTWDVAFLAVDPARADRLAFTRPYVVIDTTYAVRSDSPFQTVASLDARGLTLLVARGSAYDLHLTKTLRLAELIRADSPSSSIERFLAGEADAVAGVRQTLASHFSGLDGFRILPDAIVSVGQAMALPRKKAQLAGALDAFLDRAHADGEIGNALEESGVRGVKIPDRP